MYKITGGFSKRMGGRFTLVELMVVVVILGVLGTIIMPRIMDRPEQARVSAARAQIRNLESALRMFRLDVGRYPTSSEGLRALVSDPGADGWDGPYLEHGRLPQDPWNRDFVYMSPGRDGRDYDLLSYGRDGESGGDGYDAEIRNWEID